MSFKVATCSALLLASSIGFGFSEVSLLTNGYTSTANKSGGSDALFSSSTLSLGARYAEPMTDRLHWFGVGSMEFNLYSAASGGKAPSNSANITLYGGARLYYPDFSEAVFPFVSVYGGVTR